MAEAALAKPHTIKISSKRQITIPASAFKKLGFSDYALCTETENGLLIQPIKVNDEEVAVSVLRHLLNQGLEGDELLEEFKQQIPMYEKLSDDLEESRRAYREGRVTTWEEIRNKARSRHGL